MPAFSLSGGCQCRSVRYQLTSAPRAVYACHCLGCQRQSGSAFGLSMIVEAAALVITGDLGEWRRTSDSGRFVHCLFCAVCGARILHQFDDAATGLAVIKPGTLDDTRDLRPAAHIWVKHAQDWTLPLREGAQVFEEQPDMVALLAGAAPGVN